jgi:spermidine synthase
MATRLGAPARLSYTPAMSRRPNFVACADPLAASPPLVRTSKGRRTLAFESGDIQSEMLLARPFALTLQYTRAMMCFALFVPRPRHILMVGLGGGSLVKFCHRHFPDCHITVVELRADVIALREQFLVPPDDVRLRVVHADAVEHVRTLAARGARPFDVILVDGFGADGLPPALGGAAFYRDCRAVLRKGGVLVANVFTYDPRYPAVLDALDAVFARRTCWFDKIAGNNRIVFALHADDGAAGNSGNDLPALRRLQRLARRRGLGLGLLNRLCARLLVAWLTWRSVLVQPH